MFDNITKFLKRFSKEKEEKKDTKTAAKERLHLVLMQDRANVSADFMELMKQEIIEVIKKYIDVDENAIDVKLTNKQNSDGTTGAPILYANIPILNVKDDTKQLNIERKKEEDKKNDDTKQEQNGQKDKTEKVEENTESKEVQDENTEKKNEEEERNNIEAEQKVEKDEKVKEEKGREESKEGTKKRTKNKKKQEAEKVK